LLVHWEQNCFYHCALLCVCSNFLQTLMLGQGENHLNIVSSVCLGNSFLHPCQFITTVLSVVPLSVLSLPLTGTGGKFKVGLGRKWLTWTQPSCVHLYNIWLYVALYDYYCLLTVLKRHAWSTSKPGIWRNFPTPCLISVRMYSAKGMYHNFWFKAGWCRSSMGSVSFETLPGYSANELWNFMPVLRKC